MESSAMESVVERSVSRRQMLGWSSAAIAAGGLAAAGISTPASAQSPTATHAEGDFAGLVDIGGRSLYLTCAGSGSPTVVLVTGYRDTSDIWTIDQRNLTDPRTMVMPSVAAFTYRALAYERWASKEPRTDVDGYECFRARAATAPRLA